MSAGGAAIGADPVLALNSGSSSLKFALYAGGAADETCLAEGAAEGLGLDAGRFWIRRPGSEPDVETRTFAGPDDAIRAVFEALDAFRHPRPAAVGHRFVTGGPGLVDPVRVDADVRRRLEAAVPYAPLHLPSALKALDAVGRHFPDLPQVVCFDTAFHAALPERAARLPVPRALFDQGIRKYGFHGLSYESIVVQLGSDLPDRLVIAHLGSGASLAAVRRGRSVDTTMGLTPAGGVVMATRPGDVDPGLLVFLQATAGYDAARLEHLVNHESGLLGISGLTGDMAALLAEAAQHAEAGQAVDLFVYSVQKAVAAMAAALSGLDALVFTGGIGEHAAPVRSAICAPLGFLGIELDAAANAGSASLISARTSRVTVRVLPAQEERMIARHTRSVLVSKPPTA